MELTQKGEMVSRLQAKAGQIGKILNNLEKYNHLLKDDKKSTDSNRRPERRPISRIVENKENISKNVIVESSKEHDKPSKSTDKPADSKDESKPEHSIDEARLSSDSTDSFVKLDLDSDEKSNA